MVEPDEILGYWLDDVGPKGWYGGGAELDDDIRSRFLSTWHGACDGSFGLWLTYPAGTLAYIILTDQFPRNMFRNHADAFSTDSLARAAAKIAIGRNWDMRISEPARGFFYLPLMHTENLMDQDRAVRLILTRMPQADPSTLLHAKAHREVIRRFGRFPHRNADLGRVTTAAEQEHLDAGAYGAVVRELAAADPATHAADT